MRRYQGSWHLERHPVFPDHVILDVRDRKQLEDTFRNDSCLRAYQREDTGMIPLTDSQEQLLKSLSGKNHNLSMSSGYIRSGHTYVTDGPLQGREHLIRKIDRHKRLARLKLAGMEEISDVCLGLEIVSKE